MQTTLQITIKSVYGRETIYPVCDQAKRLAARRNQDPDPSRPSAIRGDGLQG